LPAHSTGKALPLPQKEFSDRARDNRIAANDTGAN
jgi:hypothetical protein